MKKISNLLMMALLTVGMGLTSCDEQLDNAVNPGVMPVVDEKGEVTSIKVDLSKIDEKYLDTEKTKLQLTVGDEVELSFTILPEEMADTEVELTADDETILSIDGLKVKALKAGETKVTAKAGDKTAECTVTVKIPGLLAGVFSVSDTKKVQFSQGNLQFQASTSTWRFAEHQYDYVGDDTKGNVLVESTKSNNASISETYTGWIDLFGWGTSGHKFASDYGTAYQPWSTSMTVTDYGPTGTSNGLYGSFAQGDWGTNMVPAGWRTLTGGSSGEWSYLFNTRTTGGTVFGTAQARYAHATINTDVDGGVNGIILFPDGVDIASTEVTTDGTVNGNSDWATKCTSAQWTALEAKGCVFLPAAGERSGSYVSDAGSYGRYWSSSHESSPAGYASHVYFFSNNLEGPTYHQRYYGHSVRLVRDVAE